MSIKSSPPLILSFSSARLFSDSRYVSLSVSGLLVVDIVVILKSPECCKHSLCHQHSKWSAIVLYEYGKVQIVAVWFDGAWPIHFICQITWTEQQLTYKYVYRYCLVCTVYCRYLLCTFFVTQFHRAQHNTVHKCSIVTTTASQFLSLCSRPLHCVLVCLVRFFFFISACRLCCATVSG